MKTLIVMLILAAAIILALISLEGCHFGNSPTSPVGIDTTQVD